MSQLRPLDILIIQSAIEDYQQRYPRRETPSAEVSLTWRARRWGGRRKMQIAEVESEPARPRSFLEKFRMWWKLS